MKAFTCNSMGGPSGCNFFLSASTPEELLEQSAAHIKQMADGGDIEHRKVLEMMEKMMGTTEGNQWHQEFLQIWDEKAEEQ